MKNKLFLVPFVFATMLGAQQPQLAACVRNELPALVNTYHSLHEAPELSHEEAKTSAFIAAQLRSLGYTVTDHVGKYDNPAWTGYGVVAVMKNGPGPTLMVRSELDALPVTEATGLDYASRTPGVMHACGHDIHMTVLLGTAQAMATMKSDWHGTLVFIGQPAEETINGANAMLAGGLYSLIPRPDMVIALHDSATLPAGVVATTPGYSMASATSVEVTLHGLSAHGSAPELGKDPVVAAAQLVLALQTIVSRETSPFDQAVVTVGSIQAGVKNNVIPDSAKLLLTVRTYKEEVRQRILASIERMARGIALTDGLPPDQPPQVRVYESTPSTYNDPALTSRLTRDFVAALGASRVQSGGPIMASEDFGSFGLENHQIPICMFSLGAVDPARIAASQKTGVPLPSLHSSRFQPLPSPTIATGVTAMSSAILDLLGTRAQ
ncbi:MAG TPA: amidohydrolase [Terriglobales bacterium]|nr:amidohydrolase [Terriglobales bacterium]